MIKSIMCVVLLLVLIVNSSPVLSSNDTISDIEIPIEATKDTLNNLESNELSDSGENVIRTKKSNEMSIDHMDQLSAASFNVGEESVGASHNMNMHGSSQGNSYGNNHGGSNSHNNGGHNSHYVGSPYVGSAYVGPAYDDGQSYNGPHSHVSYNPSLYGSQHSASSYQSQQSYQPTPAYHAPSTYSNYPASDYSAQSYHSAPAYSTSPPYNAPAYSPSSYHSPAHSAPLYQSYSGPSYQAYSAPSYPTNDSPNYQSYSSYQSGYQSPAYPAYPSFYPQQPYSTYDMSSVMYSGPSYIAPSQTYSYPSPAPQAPCSSSVLVGCTPHVSHVPCSSGDYGGSKLSNDGYRSADDNVAASEHNTNDDITISTTETSNTKTMDITTTEANALVDRRSNVVQLPQKTVEPTSDKQQQTNKQQPNQQQPNQQQSNKQQSAAQQLPQQSPQQSSQQSVPQQSAAQQPSSPLQPTKPIPYQFPQHPQPQHQIINGQAAADEAAKKQQETMIKMAQMTQMLNAQNMRNTKPMDVSMQPIQHPTQPMSLMANQVITSPTTPLQNGGQMVVSSSNMRPSYFPQTAYHS